MADQPIAIDEITDPTQVRVMLYQSGQQVHAPLDQISPFQADFSGPASSVADNIVTFANATGKLGKDSGVAVSSLAPKASPALTGVPTAPTAIAGTNTTQIATTAFVAALSTVYQAASAVLTALAGIGTAVAGDVIYASGAGVWSRLTKGTARQALLMNAGATIPAWTTLPFSQSYASAQQTITAAGSLTLAHGLASTPQLYLAVLQCTTAEFGYSIADEIQALLTSSTSAASRGVAVVPDATNMNIRYGSDANTFGAVNKTSGAFVALTNANWRLVIRAWA
jgi:hypothetical protein